MRLWGPAVETMPPAGDLLNKRKSLPIVYALRNATGAERRALGDVYFKRVMEPEDLGRILEVLEKARRKGICAGQGRRTFWRGDRGA